MLITSMNFFCEPNSLKHANVVFFHLNTFNYLNI